jgi:phosphoribosylglycinamide formyltransferase-1
MVRTAVLVSGGGTNLQALIDAKACGGLPETEFIGVVSSSPDAYVLTRAANATIPAYVVDRTQFADRESFTDALTDTLLDLNAELIIEAGFLYVTSPRFLDTFAGRVLNIHPALLPSFGGEGCYGIHVHEQALAYGVKVTGATAHYVTQDTDTGPIILQKAIDVLPNDTPETLQKRVMQECEWVILPQAVDLFCKGKLTLNGRTVKIAD